MCKNNNDLKKKYKIKFDEIMKYYTNEMIDLREQ